jgi:aconitate hydratase
MESSQNPFEHLKQQLNIAGKNYTFYNLQDLKDERLATLPYSIRVLLEAAVRNCDNFNVKRT